jgi:5,10-methylenetetrahydromethanopterin reductase
MERFGLGISNCHPIATVTEAVHRAEALGAEVAFIAEDVGCRDAFQLATACAGITDRIRLSTGVVNPFTRAPMSLAMATSTLDEVSGGRAMLGLGTSSASLIESMLGIPRESPPRVMREATEIIRALLAGESVTYRGTRFVHVDAHLQARTTQPHIPIYFAAMGPQMLRLAGRMADGVLLNVFASPQYVRWAVAQIVEGADRAGRSPGEVTIAAWLAAYVDDDREAALNRSRMGLARMLSVSGQGELLLEHSDLDTRILGPIRETYSAYPDRGDLREAARRIPDDVAEQLALVGSADEVRERLDAYRGAGLELPVFAIGALERLYSGSV